MQEITLDEAFLKLVASGYLTRIELSVAQYIYLYKREITVSEITQAFNWKNYRTSKAIKNLMHKKIVEKQYYGVVVLNPHYKVWLNGKVAKFGLKVASDNFDENITEELYMSLVKFAKSRGLQVDDAEDAVMTSLLKAKEKYKQFKQGTNFRGWIFTIVSNTILDSRKKKKENQLFENELEDIVDTQKSVFDTLEMKSQMVKFKEKFSLLHPYYQNLLTLYANEVPYKDVSILLDTPEGTVKSKIHRAKIKFMDLINDH
jgi:RNA polymerase sigma-70 factor (ECF subfamily)